MIHNDIGALWRLLSSRDKTIEALNFEVIDKEKVIRNLETKAFNINQLHDVLIQQKDAVIQQKEAVIQQKYISIQTNAVLVQQKEFQIQEKELKLQHLNAELLRLIEEYSTRNQQLQSQIQDLYCQIHLKNVDIEEKEKQIQYQASILISQQALLKNYRPLRPLLIVGKLLSGPMSRLKTIFSPRLGNLNQYYPRPLTIQSSNYKSIRTNGSLKISIVTPSFQQGMFIERTIQSVLNQKYSNLEYYVQDGGSTDNTIEVLRKYENQLTGWVSQKDSGQSEAINKGLSKTSGEIMAWINSDDLLMPGALLKVVNFFERNPDVDVLYGNRLLINEDDLEIGRWIIPGHDSEVLTWADYVPQETLFWRRRIWDKVGRHIDESFRFALDWDLLIRFREAEAKFAHIPHFLGAFRVHENQKTSAEINEVGVKEMNLIRARILGKVPSNIEISRAVGPYLIKHILVDLIYRLKIKFR